MTTHKKNTKKTTTSKSAKKSSTKRAQLAASRSNRSVFIALGLSTIGLASLVLLGFLTHSASL